MEPTRTELRQAIRYARGAGDDGAVAQAEAALSSLIRVVWATAYIAATA